MRRIKKVEIEREVITCDFCGIDFTETKYITFECTVCHKDVCRDCVKQIKISSYPFASHPPILNLCPRCFRTLTLKKLEELECNE